MRSDGRTHVDVLRQAKALVQALEAITCTASSLLQKLIEMSGETACEESTSNTNHNFGLGAPSHGRYALATSTFGMLGAVQNFESKRMLRSQVEYRAQAISDTALQNIVVLGLSMSPLPPMVKEGRAANGCFDSRLSVWHTDVDQQAKPAPDPPDTNLLQADHAGVCGGVSLQLTSLGRRLRGMMAARTLKYSGLAWPIAIATSAVANMREMLEAVHHRDAAIETTITDRNAEELADMHEGAHKEETIMGPATCEHTRDAFASIREALKQAATTKNIALLTSAIDEAIASGLDEADTDLGHARWLLDAEEVKVKWQEDLRLALVRRRDTGGIRHLAMCIKDAEAEGLDDATIQKARSVLDREVRANARRRIESSIKQKDINSLSRAVKEGARCGVSETVVKCARAFILKEVRQRIWSSICDRQQDALRSAIADALSADVPTEEMNDARRMLNDPGMCWYERKGQNLHTAGSYTSGGMQWGIFEENDVHGAKEFAYRSTSWKSQDSYCADAGDLDLPMALQPPLDDTVRLEVFKLSGDVLCMQVPRTLTVSRLRRIVAKSFDRKIEPLSFDLVWKTRVLVDDDACPFAGTSAKTATLNLVRRTLWQEDVDANGETFYWNELTGEVSYKLPSDCA